MTAEEQVQQLWDRAAISDVVHRYATGLDTHNWPLLRSIFTDEIEMDFASIGMRPGRMTADSWVESARVLFAGFDATQHLSANHVHDIRGDEATCTSYMRAEHFVLNNEGENYYTMGGYYTNELVRTPEGWKLRGVTLTVTWNRGNRHVLRLALQRGRERLGLRG
ncbi:MAG: nuclear transport factor 2 family protein [Chloroflexi bacterium]|nr:nuclear transport factor 2 family protein [Chloroflexota bacterium]